jgi:hypothetical protein
MRSPERKDDRVSEYELKPFNLTINDEDEQLIDEFDSEADMEILRISDKYSKRRNQYVIKLRTIGCISLVVFLIIISSLSMAHRSSENVDSMDQHPHRSKIALPSHKAFNLIRSKFLESHQATFSLYQHKKTKAEFVGYVPLDTKNDKVFGISFRTKPTSSTGVAHILEHSVLSGSEKYPAKDPFLILLKGSLYTFLNAMTYNDRTV